MNKWQPIETAPEHGQFLVYMPDEPTNKIQAANYHPNVRVIGNHFAFDLTKPTHWMPLPQPPEAEAQEERTGVKFSNKTGGAYAEIRDVIKSEREKA